MTDEQIKSIRERLAAVNGRFVNSVAFQGFVDRAPADLALLLDEVERLRALVAEMAPHAVEGAAEYGHRDLVDRFSPYAGPPYSD